MLALRHDMIRARPDTAPGSRYIKLRVKLDPPDAVAQPERVVAIKLISGYLPATGDRRNTHC